MAEADVPNGWLRRARGFSEILSTPSGVLAIVLALTVGWASGWIPFKPFDNLSTDLRAHHEAMNATIRNRESSEGKTLLILERLSLTLTRMDRRAQIIDCARLTDTELRRECLK